MADDLDNDLGDLEDLDLGDESAADAAAGDEGAAGGESVELDADLQSMLGDSGGGDPSAGGGDAAGAEDSSGGSVDDMLGAMRAGEEAGSAPPPASAGGRAAPTALPGTAGLSKDQVVNLEFLLDIKLHVTFEVGRSKMLISDLLTLGQGSVIELHRLVGDELDLLINGKLVAKGEVVVVNEKFGCKITDIIAPEDRIKHLGAV